MNIKRVLNLALLVVFSAGFLLPAEAQIEDVIERYAGVNADGFIEPLITGFGANLNSGMYRSARIPRTGFYFSIGLNSMMSIYSDDQRVFTATTTGYFYPPQQVETATIIGDTRGTIVTSPSGTEYIFPGGFDMKSLMIAAPIVTVGSVFGTEASLRYIKAEFNEDIGEVYLLGIGVRHSISQYFAMLPVDIAAGVIYHTYKISEIVEGKVYSVHAEVGKSFTMMDVYGGMAMESNTANLEYVFDSGVETENVSIDVTGKNKFRLTVGAGFNFGLFHFNLDYNFGHQRVANAGISIGL